MSAAASAGSPSSGLPDGLKLLIGAGGIYAAFLYYGSLQEDVFRYVSSTGSQFKQAWFLQVLEAAANVLVGWIGMTLSGATRGIPLKMFGISGAAQVSAKAFTSLALANGLSFPVATLAKSGKVCVALFVYMRVILLFDCLFCQVLCYLTVAAFLCRWDLGFFHLHLTHIHLSLSTLYTKP